MRRFTAELAEHAEKPWELFSAGFAASAFNVMCSHAFQTEVGPCLL
jgi:hypothetical protein